MAWEPTWTNFNGVSLPTIRASDLGYYEQQYGGYQPAMGDGNASYTEPFTQRIYQLNGDAYGGLSGDGRNAFNSWSRNFAVSQGEDENSFYVKVKTGDKEGTNVRYVRQGDTWVPEKSTGKEGWDTNHGDPMDLVRAIAVVAIPFAAAAAAASAGVGAAAEGAAAAGTAAAEGAAASTAGNAALYESAYGAGSALGGEAGAITAPASAWGTTGTGYIAGTAPAAAGFTEGAGVIAGEASGAMAAPAVTTQPGILDRVLDFYDSRTGKLVRAGANVVRQMGGGGETQPLGTADPGDVNMGQPVGTADPANVNVGAIKLGIPTGSGGRKPGAFNVPTFDPYAIKAPEAPQAPGVINQQIKL